MARISELLKWKDWVMLKDPDGKDLKKIWLRIIGDEDLKDAFAISRVASAQTRKDLRDPKTMQFKERIEPLREATFEECLEIILASRSQNLTADAISNTERPELVKLEEIAVDADAPTLEEQEKLDAANAANEAEYQKALANYIDQKKLELNDEWKDKPLKEIREAAELEASAIIAIGVFFETLEQEKCWRSVYEDEACKVRGFSDVTEYKEMNSYIKEQILENYRKLEIGPDEIKNSRKADLGEQP